MKPRYDQVPEELRALTNWVVWKLEKRTSSKGVVRTTKVPYNARSGKHAKSNDHATWSDFGAATEALKCGYEGLGFCLTVPYVGVDLDGCRPNGTDEPWAEEIVGELNSYTELSPSGTGLHVITKGQLPDGPRQKDFEGDHHGVGLYDAARGRYLTMTGCRVRGNGTIAERTGELAAIHARLFPPKAGANAKTSPPSDDELIARACNANDGGRFSRLWNGQWEGDYSSQSEADLGLCMRLAFWTGRDAGRIDALFRRSGMMREKWNRADYRERTIAAAIARQTETYQPAGAAPPRDASINLAALTPSIATLNAMSIFGGRVRFQSLRRRGTLIQATFEGGGQSIFRTAIDLTSFGRAQNILFEGTGILIPTPPARRIRHVWEPVAQLLRNVADLDAVGTAPPLRDEFAEILRSVWTRAKHPLARDSDEFVEILADCLAHHRDPSVGPPRCAVWIDPNATWIHLPTLLEFLSTPQGKNRHYPFDDARAALLLLDCVPRELHRSSKQYGTVHARVWEGPLSLLEDDETEPGEGSGDE
jgi:hypothetical protein